MTQRPLNRLGSASDTGPAVSTQRIKGFHKTLRNAGLGILAQ
jgi:hypothetical protein